jgi:hypothetical protein
MATLSETIKIKLNKSKEYAYNLYKVGIVKSYETVSDDLWIFFNYNK